MSYASVHACARLHSQPYHIDFLSSICSVPAISLDQDSYAAMENATLSITILRSGDLTLPVAVYLTIAPISTDNAAQGK